MPRQLVDRIDPGWAEALQPVADDVARMGEFLRAEVAAGRGYLPAGANVLRAFHRPLADVRVLIVGQDPYPTPGHPVGLSFSVDPDVRPVPRSLANIYRELVADLGVRRPSSATCRRGPTSGVLLLNRVLTVQPGQVRRRTAARAGKPSPSRRSARWWSAAARWSRSSGAGTPRRCDRCSGRTPYVASAHPSPMSADRGFFGSRPFSRVNDLLTAQGAARIDWSLP